MKASSPENAVALRAFGRLVCERLRVEERSGRWLARHTGLCPHTIVRLRRGQIDPGFLTFINICRALNLAPGDALEIIQRGAKAEPSVSSQPLPGGVT